MQLEHVVFDVGQVLIQWDPRHLYRKLIPDPAEMERFLEGVCTPDWNLEQDRGRPWERAIAELTPRFPSQAALIRAYFDRWDEMVPGPVPGVPEILARLQAAGVATYAITNFSAETWPRATARFPFLTSFRDTVVSGREGVIKPDPAIYRLLLDRNGLEAGRCLFIDDSERNVRGAEAVGMRAHHFRDAATLAAALRASGLPAPGAGDPA